MKKWIRNNKGLAIGIAVAIVLLALVWWWQYVYLPKKMAKTNVPRPKFQFTDAQKKAIKAYGEQLWGTVEPLLRDEDPWDELREPELYMPWIESNGGLDAMTAKKFGEFWLYTAEQSLAQTAINRADASDDSIMALVESAFEGFTSYVPQTKPKGELTITTPTNQPMPDFSDMLG